MASARSAMRVADEAGRRGVDHLELGDVDAELLGEELEHHDSSWSTRAAASSLPSRSLTVLTSGREVTTAPQKSNRLNRYFTLTPRASARPTVSRAALPPTLNSPELNCVA